VLCNKRNNVLSGAIAYSNLTGATLAKQVGLSPVTISNIINGHTIPNLRTAMKISNVLQRSVEELFIVHLKENILYFTRVKS